MLKKLGLFSFLMVITSASIFALSIQTNPIQTPETNFKRPIEFTTNMDMGITSWVNKISVTKVSNNAIKTAKIFLDNAMQKPAIAVRVEDRLYCGSGGCSTYIITPNGKGDYSVLFDAVTHNISFSNRTYNTWAGIFTNNGQYEWGFEEKDFVYVPLK